MDFKSISNNFDSSTLADMLSSLFTVLYAGLFYRIYKYFVRWLTGKCEIQRIIDRHLGGNSGQLARELYVCLQKSKQCKSIVAPLLPRTDNKTALVASEADLIALRLLSTKRLSGQALPDAPLRMRMLFAVSQIAEFQRLRLSLSVDQRRRHYDESNAADELKLEQLWSLLRPEIRRSSRYTDEWNELGFQGNNPATDFRGMGILGLESLVHFASAHPKAARRVCNESLVPNNKWFSFAITHINLAYDVVNFCELEPELVAPVFLQEGPTIDTFHQFVAVLMVRFHEHWRLSNPPNVMSFQPLHDAFLSQIRSELYNQTFQLSHPSLSD